MKLTLEALTGNSAPRQLDTARDGQVWLLLGRGAECQWRFGEPMVSTRHATLHAEKDGFYLTDQQSTNCTLVNGVRVQRVLLRDGDVIQLGYSGPQLVARIAPARAAEPVVANAVPPPPATPA
jgi:pSer/pThr/pTyr-binding forkhead associated (FHA) protein